ncbi:hypothetical protein GMDG_00209 [Pseudogymnoascus destructans 20631-21]|uniref:Uncharacterized protein n=1 Tax=Pseudogymnoascus destructans (strain ATCC MYA-4855 / 20631-21) TaxID=658429 RepID=L8FVP0_PSED2|nr:hypothetical protein GMDG_00209 [Pseudogymnoascus destructans 20631-21]
MRLTLASVAVGLFACANAAVVATPVATNDHEARIQARWPDYEANCDLGGGGPGWGGFLKVHSAFTKLWASTPAGFCVDQSNWACVACDDVYLYFEPQVTNALSVCYTRDQFGAIATLFDDVARQGQGNCYVGVNEGLWGYGYVYQNYDVQDRGCLRRC